MSGPTRIRSTWIDFPNPGFSVVTGTEFGTLDQRIVDLQTNPLNVLDFGAVPTQGNVTPSIDSTTPFTNALAAGTSEGLGVRVPLGNYLVSNLTIPSRTYMFGYGRGSAIYQKSGTVSPIFQTDSTIQNEFITMRDLLITGNSNQASNTGGLLFSRTNDLNLSRLIVTFCKNYGIKHTGAGGASGCQNALIRDSHISSLLDASTVGILLASSTTASPDGARVLGNTISSTLGTGFKVDKGTVSRGFGADFTFAFNNVQECPTFYDIDGSDGALFRNRFEVTSGSGAATIQSTASRTFLGQNTYAAPVGFTLTDSGTGTIRWMDNERGTIINSLAGPRMITGTGIPAVAAPVGSLFFRTDGGAGTSLYVKESGTGTAGWVGK